MGGISSQGGKSILTVWEAAVPRANIPYMRHLIERREGFKEGRGSYMVWRGWCWCKSPQYTI